MVLHLKSEFDYNLKVKINQNDQFFGEFLRDSFT